MSRKVDNASCVEIELSPTIVKLDVHVVLLFSVYFVEILLSLL